MRALNLSYSPEKRTEIEDEQHIIDKATKDARAFAPLYTKYFKRIYLFLLKRCSDENLASDLCSQTFLKALNSLEKYDHRGVPFSAWLYRIAYNEFLLHYRSEKCKRAVYANQTDITILSNEIEENEDAHEREEILKRALAHLKEEELLLIEMKYFEHKQYDEIAEITGLSISNAKVKVHRIIKKLNALVQ